MTQLLKSSICTESPYMVVSYLLELSRCLHYSERPSPLPALVSSRLAPTAQPITWLEKESPFGCHHPSKMNIL